MLIYTMTRSPGDVVVSAFHHFIRVGNLPEETSFSEFFWKDKGPSGQSVVRNLLRYQATWDDTPTDRVFRTTYEDFHADASREVGRLGAFCRIEMSPAQIETIVRTTSFDNWKSATGTQHLRKGLVGESASVLSDEMSEQLSDWLQSR